MSTLLKSERLSSTWEEDYELTHDFEEAIFIDHQGQMLWGECDCGIRGLDHNCLIKDQAGDREEQWREIHNDQIVRLVPESRTALISSNQQLTDIQKYYIDLFEYDIKVYI